MQRTLIKDLPKSKEKKVTIIGRITSLRQMGNITFIILSDYTDSIQAVFEKKIDVKFGEAVAITGSLKKDDRAKSGYEISGEKIEIISKNQVEELPVDISKRNINLQLTTLLDNRTLSLRHPKVKAIFKLYSLLLEAYDSALRENGFTEIKTPKILEAASEGGANFFKLDYFEKEAFLAQSPQFYKQIMVGVFERVFEIGPAFRAEPSFTTRHVTEYISMDAEMGFIESYEDVIKMLNIVLVKIVNHLEAHGKQYLEEYNVEKIKISENIPCFKLSDAKKIIKEKYNYDVPKGVDIDPQGERLIGQYAREELDSDFVFLTHYPWSDRPFYTMPNVENQEETCGFDLIYKGVELATGGQRIHDYAMLIENMKKKNIKPKGLEFYLDVFKYAMPPHGGWGMGSERFIQQLLGLASVKEAVLFPRDVKRLNP